MSIQDLSTLVDAHSIIIDSGAKVGKITFLSYLIISLFKSKAILFTPQESYLFNRRVDSLSKQFKLFSDLKDFISPYFLKKDWHKLKQKYGYAFLIQELEHLIIHSEEKIIVIHRIGEFFEFQDRYEIENVYKSLVKLAVVHDKKIIFLANHKNENFEYIYNVSEEFSDVSISITINEKNERILNIKNILHNQEYPLMIFKIHEGSFILDYYKETQEIIQDKLKNILIAEISQAHDSMKDICSYIFNKPKFSIKYADSLKSILQEIFVRPDIIIVLMKREQENLEIVKAIKMQLPDTAIIIILDQDFVRAEDIQEAYNYGCDELFANNLSLDNLILAFQKASKTPFYTQAVSLLTKQNNVIENFDDFKKLAYECVKNSIFFTAFTFESKKSFERIGSTSRQSDFIYQTEYKIYYLAINTVPRDIQKIISHYKKKHDDIVLTCIWEPINHVSLEECLS